MNRRSLNTLACAIAVLLAAGRAGADPYRDALGYKLGQPRDALAAIEDQVRLSSPEKLRGVEDRLLGLLASAEATPDCKDWVCRQLRQAGSVRSVRALAPLLADKQLATVARLALQSIPGPEVDAALRDALGTLTGPEKAGVLQTLGQRRDRQAVPQVARLVADPDPAVAEMALFALGRIGGPEALAAVRQSKVPQSLARYRFHAMLLCAESLPDPEAAGAYAAVLAASTDPVVRIAALRGLVRLDPLNARPEIEAALQSDNKPLRLAAVQLVCESGRAELLATALQQIGTLPGDARVALLSRVSDRAAVPYVLAAARAGDESIALAAIAGLARIGGPEVVGPLLEIASTGQGALQAAARATLAKLRTRQPDEALLAAAQQASPPARAEALRALAARATPNAVPALLKVAGETDKTVQAAAFEALGALVDAESLPELVKLLAASKDAAVCETAQAAVVAACRRVNDLDTAAAPVLAALRTAGTEARPALLGVLAQLPSAGSLAALRAALPETDPALKDAAVRGLAAWPKPEVLDDLLAIARTSDRPLHTVLALRGIARLAATAEKLPSAQKTKILVEALAVANRPDEKRLVLGALADMRHPAALDAAMTCLTDKAVELEAATTAVRVAQFLRTSQPDAAKSAIARVLQTCKNPTVQQMAERALLTLDLSANIAPQGTATSPDGLEKDGASHGDQAAIDNNPDTYWDKQDNQPLYRLLVTFKEPQTVAAISITGYKHENYAPRTFDILCDGKLGHTVKDAHYNDNLLVVGFPPVTCKTVELKITAAYGASPAIRELGIYRPTSK